MKRHPKLGQVEKSALGHHGCNMGHPILLGDMTILYRSTSYEKRLVREATEIYLAEDVINKEDGTRLSNAWLPTLELVKVVRPAAAFSEQSDKGMGEGGHLGTCQAQAVFLQHRPN